jgi:hypothetical protein
MSRETDSPDADEKPDAPCGCHEESVAAPRRSRWRLALDVLLGKPVVPQQIYLEWLEYRVLFDDLLKRFGAQLARNAKAEHKRIRETLDGPSRRDVAAQIPSAGKARVRAIIAQQRGISGGRMVMPRPPESFEEPDLKEDAG